MQLKAFKYIKFQDKPNEWIIEGCDGDLIKFGNMNLIVGKNAVGKSRTLGVIREIAELLSLKKELSELPFKDNNYHLLFDDNGKQYEYQLKIVDKDIIEEKILIDGVLKLDRAQNKIFSETEKTLINFQFQKNISTSNYSDLNYPFLYTLYLWGDYLYKVNFTNQIEKKKIFKTSDYLDIQDNPKDLHNMLNQAKKLYGKNFDDQIIKDMQVLEYDLASLEIAETSKGYEIVVHEKDLSTYTGQVEMSQGMYRALSFIILLNYTLFSENPACILIDDLGEGLDFDRSRAITRLIIEKTEESNIQIFITTNDRYIMNIIPVEHWSVIERKLHKSVFYNYFNSQKNFEDFKYTGLSNIDFLATQFYINGFGEA